MIDEDGFEAGLRAGGGSYQDGYADGIRAARMALRPLLMQAIADQHERPVDYWPACMPPEREDAEDDDRRARMAAIEEHLGHVPADTFEVAGGLTPEETGRVIYMEHLEAMRRANPSLGPRVDDTRCMAARDEARLAERARIRKLAIEHYAMCDCLGDCAVGVPHRQPFADLLGPEDPS